MCTTFFRRGRSAGVAIVIAMTACNSNDNEIAGPAPSREISAAQAISALAAVNTGNARAVESAPRLASQGAPLAPFIEARLYAIANIAMHDAANGIVARYQRYADKGPLSPNANIAAAVLTAAHDAIVGANPAAKAETDAWYSGAIAAEQSQAGMEEGILLGRRAAAAILAMRANDGTADGGVAPYTPGHGIGDYQFTFPFNTPAFDMFGTGGFADASKWGANAKPFVVESTRQFRVRGPYQTTSNLQAVLTDEYGEDLNEVKAIGCNACPLRTATQTEIGLFWLENSPTAWNRVARDVALDAKLDAWKTARLYALLQIAEFDVYATNLESKYFYNFWRPVTAIAQADNDENRATISSQGWEALGFPSPPVPDYPSAHAGAGAAAAAVLKEVAPGATTPLNLHSTSLPGVTRTFASAKEAAIENGLSRIYVGFHFREAVNMGNGQGTNVGEFVARTALKGF